MDTWREDDRFMIALDLPGILPEAIEVQPLDRTVTVKAERRPTPRGEGARTPSSPNGPAGCPSAASGWPAGSTRAPSRPTYRTTSAISGSRERSRAAEVVTRVICSGLMVLAPLWAG